MLGNYFKIAFRNLWKNKAFSILNILGLAIALAVAIVIFLYISLELSTDSFQKNKDNIYLVSTATYYTTPPVLLKNIGEDLPGLEGKLRIWNGELTAMKGDERINFKTFFADSSFFSFFSFKLLYGNRSEVLKEKGNIVLTKSLAEKVFGTYDVTGKTIELTRPGSTKKATYLISGIMEDVPENSSMKFEAVTNFYSLENLFKKGFDDDFSEWSYISFILLDDNTDVKQFKKKFDKKLLDLYSEFNDGFSKEDMADEEISELIRFSDLYFNRPDIQLFNQGNKRYIYIYLSIAVFILLIAAVNYINLSTALSLERTKETGIRMVFGAWRKQLITKFLVESVLITVIAFIIACTIVELLLPAVNSRIPKDIHLSLYSGPYVLILFGLGAILFGIITGLFPAFYMSRVQASSILKGELTKGKKGDKLRSGLIVFQFLISAVLISFTLTVYYQLSFLKNMDMGFDKENILVIGLNLNIQSKKELLKSEMQNLSFVEKASLVRGIPGRVYMGWGRSYKDHDIHFTALLADEDMIPLLNMTLVKGRNFNKGDKNGAYIVNETLAKRMETENPLNEKIGGVPVVGVVKNFNFQSAKFHIEPLALYYGNFFSGYKNYLLLKVDPGISSGQIEEIEKIWDSYSPELPFDYMWFDKSFDRLYEKESRLANLFLLFSILSLLIVTIGLFGLSAYIAKQKTKEIGIRKVLGAYSANILELLSRRFLLLVLIANIIALPVAWYVMDLWLANFANRITIPYYAFLLSFLFSVLITIITVSWQSLKAARMNPVDAIKYE